ncbi:TM2 domain-containing protein [Nocardioides pyridinolyticus]
MTQGPEEPLDPNQQQPGQPDGQPDGQSGDQSGGQSGGQSAPPPPYQEAAPPPYGQPIPPQYPQAGYGYNPAAPYGVHPVTGLPYSDKSKLVAGLLQILIPLGIGRFYIGDTKTGVWQLVVTILTCGIGALWPFIDGIIILATDSTDAQGRPLRAS